MTRYLLIGMAVLGLASGIQSIRVSRLKTELVVAQRDLKTANDLATELANVGQADAENQAEKCKVRVAQARRSAQRIETVIERPIHVDPEGCAVRSIVGANELRDALTP